MCSFQSQRSRRKQVVLLLIDRLVGEDQAEGEAPKFFLNMMFCHVVYDTDDSISDKFIRIPRIGGAEILKLQEAIPPFSLIEDSIQGRRVETLVKTA